MSDQPKILFLDIETAPLEVYAWGLWKVNVGLNQILTEWSILSYSAKWLGKRRMIYKDQRGKHNVRDDADLLQEIWHLLNEADIVVAQNGIRFDVRKIRARFILLGMPPPSPFRVIDTLVAAKQLFGFTSNKLAWLAPNLTGHDKYEHKKFPGFELWIECLKDNPAAWREMKTYNCIDTSDLEAVYLKMRPWIEGHPNVAAYTASEEPACPKCGSSHITLVPKPWRTDTGEYPMYHCNECGGWSRGRYTQNTLAKRKVLLRS